MKIRLENWRISFAYLWDNLDQFERRSAAFLAPPDHPDIKRVEDAIKAVAAEAWPNMDKKTGRPQWETILKEIKGGKTYCLHSGDGKPYDGYDGMMYVSASNKDRAPLVVNADPFIRDEEGNVLIDPKTNKPVPNLVTEESGIVYSGCYVNATIEIWAQDNRYGKGVNANLRAVQFLADGDAFAAGPPSDASEFDDVSVARPAPPARHEHEDIL